MPDTDPLRPTPDPFRPPEPEPYRSPDWNPARPPPFEPPGQPNPVDPTRNPWGLSTVINFILAFAVVGVLSSTAYAAATLGGGTMPWSTPLQNLRADLTGPTAVVLALIGFVCVMAILVFGGELNHFGRSICFLILAASSLVGANNLLAGIGVAGATIDSADGFDGFVGGIVTASLCWAAMIWVWRRRARRGTRNLTLALATPH